MPHTSLGAKKKRVRQGDVFFLKWCGKLISLWPRNMTYADHEEGNGKLKEKSDSYPSGTRTLKSQCKRVSVLCLPLFSPTWNTNSAIMIRKKIESEYKECFMAVGTTFRMLLCRTWTIWKLLVNFAIRLSLDENNRIERSDLMVFLGN